MKTLFPELDELESLAPSPSPQPSPVPTFRNCPILEPDAVGCEQSGWWFGTPFPDWPQCGPYATRKECEEARASFVRNWIGHFTPSQVVTSQIVTGRETRPT